MIKVLFGAAWPLAGYAYAGYPGMIIGVLIISVITWGQWLVGNWIFDQRVRDLGHDPSILDDLDD